MWHLKQQSVQMNWTLVGNICRSVAECWDSPEGDESSGQPFNFPQICPLQLQHGDKLLMAADETLKSYGIRILNVSENDFESCSTNKQTTDQFLFPHDVNESEQVEAKWLVPGHHYFIALHEGDTQLCKFGLRLNVSVKTQLCQASPLLRLCSGHGICQTGHGEGAYYCRCHHQYSGRFCEKFDICLDNPCENKGVCLSNGSTDPNHRTYKCLCPPHFTGINCSEVIGKENCDRVCENGTCVQVASSSFKCICNTGFTGKRPSSSRLQAHNAIEKPCAIRIHAEMVAFAKRAPKDSSVVVQKEFGVCTVTPALMSIACHTHVRRNKSAPQRSVCLRGFSGKNCEEIIDYCRLLNINCLNEGLCLSVIGGYQCVCAPGWIGEFCQYVSDTCLMKPNRCLNGATCITTGQPSSPPQYTCICPLGFTGTNCETEVNECESNPCRHSGTCSDLVGQYECQCPTGFLGKNCEVDIDACALPNNTCPPKTVCLDLPIGLRYTCRVPCPPNLQPCANGGRCVLTDASSYTCICTPGWSGQSCRTNVNDCVQHWCQNGGTCVDEIDGYRGYTGVYCEEDIDYCVGHRCSEHGVCLDQQYNFTCRCMLGFEGLFCELETNECNSFPCASGATCVDLISDYQCHCPPGFEGRTCSENVNDCWSQPCLNGGSCKDLINDYICHCPLGFGGSFCEVNLNECESKPCQNGGVCVDDVDLYQCFCSEGFGGLNCEINYDECVHGYCANNSTCIDLVADYECICPLGFAGLTGQFCEINIDDCEEKPCGVLSVCKDTLDGYSCFCAPGFIGNNCEIEVNECLSQPCRNGGSCIDELNSFSCQCPLGITGNYCEVNIDECISSPCLHNATCVDRVHGYGCTCLPGFTGTKCELDIDECASSPCKNGATCIDQPGNYFCQCVAPFKGHNCEFLPCEASNPCENGAVCVEELDQDHFPLGFRCHCRRGFAGPRCEINVDECSSSPCFHGFCYDGSVAFLKFCQCFNWLMPEQNLKVSYPSLCDTRPRPAVLTNLECSQFTSVVDGFYCLCNPGYAGLRCEQDIDDCVNSLCSTNSICKDLHLSYECVCHSGWEGENCQQEIDECLSQPCKNNATCTDLLNSYNMHAFTNGQQRYREHCSRQSVAAVKYCEKEDLKEVGVKLTPMNAALIHAKTRATVWTGCDCKIGFSGLQCEDDINECASNPCLHAGVCQDLVNRFHCVCPPGYFGTLCDLDVNECEVSPCLHEGICINKPGGFECVCRPGYSVSSVSTLLDDDDDVLAFAAFCSGHGVKLTLMSAFQARAKIVGNVLTDLIDTTACVPMASLDSAARRTLMNACQRLVFTGAVRMDYIHTSVFDCASSPCLNGGSCVDLTDKYACFCQDGYTGKTCENDIDVCKEAAFNVSLCFNGATCLDGEGSNFTCSCPPGFMGDFCEVDVNECCSAPCHNGAICQDLINSYVCHCRSGWTGLHCEDDINECLPQPCNQGICIQNDPGYGYTCFCRPGFVGSNCEHNYDDCLLNPCPGAYSCIDGINKVTCLPPVTDTVPLVTVVKNITRGSTPRVPTPTLTADQSTDSSYVQYFGDSYLEFEGIDLSALNNITVRLQTQEARGTILYVDQGPANGDFFFMKLFVLDGILQYAFCCNEEEEATRISTLIRIDDGKEHIVNIRQHLTPCEVEITLSGHEKIKSTASNYWLGHMIQRTNHIFTGGLPQQYLPNQKAKPFINYTGCIEIIEINKLRSFYTSDAVASSNIDRCRYNLYAIEASTTSFSSLTTPSTTSDTVNTTTTTTTTTVAAPTQTSKHPLYEPCREGLCRNGGTCHQPQLPGVALPSCHCPLHFSGTFCEKDTTVYIPAFDGTSYLELQSLAFLLQSSGASNNLPAAVKDTTVILYLTVKTRSTQGTILYTREQNFGDNFLHVFLEDGSPVAELGCGGSHVLNAAAGQNINNNRWMPLTIRKWLQNFKINCKVDKRPLLKYPVPPHNFTTGSVQRGELCHFSFGEDMFVVAPQCQEARCPLSNCITGDIMIEHRLSKLIEACQSPHKLCSKYCSAACEKVTAPEPEQELQSIYNLPVGKQGGSCMIEIAVDNGTAHRLQEYVSHPTSEHLTVPLDEHLQCSCPTTRLLGRQREVTLEGCRTRMRSDMTVRADMKLHTEPLGPFFLGLSRPTGRCPTGAQKEHRDSLDVSGNFRSTQRRFTWWWLIPVSVCPAGVLLLMTSLCAFVWACSEPFVGAGGSTLQGVCGRLCQFTACERNPCGHGATCIPKSPLEAVCLCPYGRQGLLCDEPINITRARFSGSDEFGYTSFMAYSSIPSLSFFYEFKLKFTLAGNSSAVKDNLILFAGHKGQGNDGDDFLVLGIRNERVIHKFNLGSGIATIVSDRLNHQINIHTVAFGRSKRAGWLKVDGQRNRTGSSPGPLVGLNVFNQLFIGGYNEYAPELLPFGSRFRQGFQGCIFDVQFRTRRDRKFQVLGQPAGHPAFGRSVGQCGVTPCVHVHCRNGGTCVDSGSSVYANAAKGNDSVYKLFFSRRLTVSVCSCQCPFGWKGALCSETVSVCDVEHNPPPLCAHGSTCIPLPDRYTCQCPLGTAGLYCEKAVTISDPFFSGNRSSWMSFSPVNIRHRTVLQLQFQTLSPDGILVYTAQHLGARAGDFFCLSLTSGFVQLRYNLGDGVHVLQSAERVDWRGGTWHTVTAGRIGHRGFLRVDDKEARQNATEGMTTLDVTTDIFVGGVSTLSSVSTDATEGEPVGFTGGLRELILNGQEFELTEKGAVSGANVGDWDGTACGYKVCQKGGRCRATGSDSFMCICPPSWTGPVCNQSVRCVNNICKHGSLCAASNVTTYSCICPLGWGGRYCDAEISTDILKFVGNSYVKYWDPRYARRNLKYTRVSFSFRASTNDSLITWMGKAEQEDDDYLAIGLERGHLKIAVNLGERLTLPLTLRNLALCCDKWHDVSVSFNSTVIQVFVDNKRILFEDVDPFERYVALNYGGQMYFGGFELYRNVSVVTSGLFSKGFEGNLRNVYLFDDTKPLLFLKNSEGFNVYEGSE
ncbi:hypothetical protein PAMA_002548 [Pampus argenteus]